MALRHTPLVSSDQLNSPRSFRQLSRRGQDEQFRAALEPLIGDERFASLCRALSAEGAVSLTGLLPVSVFDRFRRTYDAQMKAKGSRGSLHNYLNVASSAPLLRHPGFWEAISHPLFVAVIAHALGGPVKLVDIRAKDTYPVDVVARDNTLHLDNSPFMDEYKVVVTWSLGSTRGPSGQGLTYLPRTNRLFRQCFVGPDGNPWSDEDACIFPSRPRVDEALRAQARFLDGEGPIVVDLTDLEAPCHTIFAASRLIHHRYRTSTGEARSAVMASFHRTDDSPEKLRPRQLARSPLGGFLVTGGSRQEFLAAIGREGPRIAAALDRMACQPDFVVDPRRHALTGSALDQWYSRQREGVTLNRLRSAAMTRSVPRGIGSVDWLVQRLQYDVQGPLNMPFFADMREARRKRARIWLREMSPGDIREVVKEEWARSRRAALPVAGSGPPVARLGACLTELGRLVSQSHGPGGSAGGGTCEPGSTEEEAALSLPAFITDLTMTASWLADGIDLAGDKDSVITATAFALVASSLSSRWYALGTAGREVTSRLFDRYLDLVREAPGARA